jgi:hypothetical protein
MNLGPDAYHARNSESLRTCARSVRIGDRKRHPVGAEEIPKHRSITPIKGMAGRDIRGAGKENRLPSRVGGCFSSHRGVADAARTPEQEQYLSRQPTMKASDAAMFSSANTRA